ncbi:glycosyl transferase, group 1 [Magnetococcus marinus MC-1]|uniref:Glycosyl transferase, group 1 n=1 Tax=Magnetococcus marinus (strain ATCC BAA-1437 / JCM 17883 / MC-1) TaxID=156889 RepID=A0LAU5_MAGMM|nr:glycosyltransferase [Magnetococcus marinus]ABK45088.1 glycosyl transferase, group 1 [Magnetococcus marinus MC-1]
MNGLKEPTVLENLYQTNHGRKAALCYITLPFANPNLGPTHPSLQTAMTMARIMADKGFDIDVLHHMFVGDWDLSRYQVLLGFGYPFERSFNKPFAGKRIYFATGAATCQRNVAELERIQAFQRRHGVLYPPRRLKPYPDYASSMLSDAIFCTGNGWTMQTYRAHFNGPIFRTPTHAHFTPNQQVLPRDYTQARTHFLWIGGAGLLLKGLDLCIEAFLNQEHVTLHVCCPMEERFLAVYAEALKTTNRIKLYGFMDLASPAFAQLLAQCGYVLFPSASEAGASSCLDAMAHGLVPVVTEQASVDVQGAGFILPDTSVQTIATHVGHLANLDPNHLQMRAQASFEKVNKHHRLEHFSQAFAQAWDAVVRPDM